MMPNQPATMRVRVLRSFYHQGEPLAVGSELDMPRVAALEVIATNKAQRADTPAPAAKPKAAAAKPEGGKDAG
jgi:hypothetical protein